MNMSYPYPIELDIFAVDKQPCQHGVVVTLHTEQGTAYELPLLRPAARLIAKNWADAAVETNSMCGYA